MRVSIVSTGEEILRGEVLDTNAAFAAAALDERGFALGPRFTCGDAASELEATLRAALDTAEVVVCSGGLGPTVDDRTLEAAAAVLGVALQPAPDLLAALRAKFTAAGLPFTDNQARQARLPRGAESLANPHGTAPGIAASSGGRWLFCLPGPPREFRPMLQQAVLPRLDRLRGAAAPIRQRLLRAFGRGEGWLADRLGPLEDELPGLELGFWAATPEIHIKLRTRGLAAEPAAELLDRAEALVRERLGRHVFASGQTGLPETVLDLLRDRDLTLAAAESCTGGLVGKLLTDVPGSSAVFLLSAVTYADEAKQRLLGVAPELLAAHGAVSEECVRAMAAGARRLAESDLALAITGIAGPGGASPDKPVGTVWFATAGADGVQTKLRRFPAFERDAIRLLAAYSALDLIRRRVTA